MLLWVGWELSHHSFSRTHADGTATVGVSASHVAEGKKEVINRHTALEGTHTTETHMSLAKACHVVTPIIRDLESAITPTAWEKKWGYLLDINHGSHHLPSGHKIFCSLSLHTCRKYSFPFPKESTHKFNPLPASQLERQDLWVM